MKNQKGFSFIELLVVVLLVALIIAVTVPAFLKEIDKARGKTLLTEVNSVRYAAQSVATMELASLTDDLDRDLTLGLTGTKENDYAYPRQAEISAKMNALLAPDIVLGEEPTNDVAKVSFKIKEGKILKLTYEKILNKKHYTVVVENQNSTVTFEKVRKNK